MIHIKRKTCTIICIRNSSGVIKGQTDGNLKEMLHTH